MAKITDYDFKNYIDTIALKESVFFKDSGNKMLQVCYSKNKTETGLEWNFKYKNSGEWCKDYKMNIQTTIFGGRLFKTTKEFVNEFGFHLQIQAPPALYKQQIMNYKDIQPVKCMMSVTIPSLLEIYKTDAWDKYQAKSGTNVNVDDVDGYLNEHLPLKSLELCVWDAKNHTSMINEIKRDRDSKYRNRVEYKDMELAQIDMCVNTLNSDVASFYNLLKYVGDYGRKNMKLYHNNIDMFDAEMTMGNYKDRNQVVNKVAGSISTKSNGLEFRRGSKSSQVVKFYDYTLKGRKYQVDNFLPIYISSGNKTAIDRLNTYYGKTTKDIAELKSTMRYEVSIRNIIGGNKGVKELYQKNFNIEQDKITMHHLFDVKYSSVVRTTLKNYLYNIFGDVITEEMHKLGEQSMNKWDLIADEGFQKGLQIMAILQLMDGDNGLSLPEIKKKCIENDAKYESVRRLMHIIKKKGYSSNWNTDRVVAMNVIKEVYDSLDKVK